MRWTLGRWLAALRCRKRAVLYACAPAFALSAASAPACPAALESAPRAAVEIHAHGVDEDHHASHGETAPASEEEPAQGTPCPHCLLAVGTANTPQSSCVAVDGQQEGRAAKSSPASEGSLPLLAAADLPGARAAPPSIIRVRPARAPPSFTVPLNIRHCVLLI